METQNNLSRPNPANTVPQEPKDTEERRKEVAKNIPPITTEAGNNQKYWYPSDIHYSGSPITPIPQRSQAQLPQGEPRSIFGSTPLPSSQMQKEAAQLYRGMNLASGELVDPKIIQEMVNMRLGLMPKYELDPNTGFYRVTEPGRPPILINPNTGAQVPFQPPVQYDPKKPIGWQPIMGPDGTVVGRRPVFPMMPGDLPTALTPQSTQPPAPIRPQAPVQPAPPTAPPTAPRPTQPAIQPPSVPSPVQPGPTGAPVPSAPTINAQPVQTANIDNLSPWKVAGDVVLSHGANQPITMAQAESKTDEATRGTNWEPYVNWANSMPQIKSSYRGLDQLDLYQRAARGDRSALGDILNQEEIEKAELKKAEVADTETAKEMNEVSKALTEGGMQGIKLRDSLKLVNHILQSPDFESGRLAAPITEVRKWIGEIKGIAERYKDLNGEYPFKGVFDSLENDLAIGKASPNEVFTKVISGAILQSLRQMLGPNSGQFRVQELKMLEQAFGNQNLSIEGNRVVMDMVDKLNDRSIVYNRMAKEYMKSHGSLDANFITAMDKYAEDHPVYSSDQYDPIMGLNPKYFRPEMTPTGGPQNQPVAPNAPANGGWIDRGNNIKIRPKPGQ